MVADFKSRWIAVGCSWMGVFILTFWNLNKIDAIESAIEKREIYLVDEQFWNYNTANISHILKKSASLIQKVESSKIGLFEFESNVRNLALTSDLNEIKLATQSQVEQDGVIPVKISFRTTIGRAASWFDRLDRELPHAQVREVNIEWDEATKQNKFAVSLSYRYRQSAEDGSI
jgi:hypothetical protein